MKDVRSIRTRVLFAVFFEKVCVAFTSGFVGWMAPAGMPFLCSFALGWKTEKKGRRQVMSKGCILYPRPFRPHTSPTSTPTRLT